MVTQIGRKVTGEGGRGGRLVWLKCVWRDGDGILTVLRTFGVSTFGVGFGGWLLKWGILNFFKIFATPCILIYRNYLDDFLSVNIGNFGTPCIVCVKIEQCALGNALALKLSHFFGTLCIYIVSSEN